MRIANLTSILAALSLTAVPALDAVAQEQPQPRPQPPAAPQASDFSDGELDQFAEVYVEVQQVRQEYQEELSSSTDPEKAQQVQKQMSDEIVGLIQDSPLSVDRYREITQASSRNAELRNELIERINALTSG